MNIPFGYCLCGCGNRTAIAKYTSDRDHCVKGLPVRYLLNHGTFHRVDMSSATPFKIEGTYCRAIPLSFGLVVIIYANDYDWLAQWKWFARFTMHSYYAIRADYSNGRDNQKIIRMHRLLTGAPEDRFVDHINRNTLDNRRCNLRICTKGQNRLNSGIRANNTSGFIGVWLNRPDGKWVAEIKINGKKICLGHFFSKVEAAKVRDDAAATYHGEFAVFNFPERQGAKAQQKSFSYPGLEAYNDAVESVRRSK